MVLGRVWVRLLDKDGNNRPKSSGLASVQVNEYSHGAWMPAGLHIQGFCLHHDSVPSLTVWPDG